MPVDLLSVRELAEMAALEASIRATQRMAIQVTGEEKWYVICAARRFKEDDALDLLARHHFEYYGPKVRKMVKIPNDRLTIKQRRSGMVYKEPRLLPLLHPYRFMRFDLRRSDWRDIFIQARIHGMIYSEDVGEMIPIVIPDREIARLRSYEIDGAIPEKTPVRQLAFNLGETIKLKEGATAGFTAIIEKLPDKDIGDIDENERIKVRMVLFGAVRQVEVPLSAIGKL